MVVIVGSVPLAVGEIWPVVWDAKLVFTWWHLDWCNLRRCCINSFDGVGHYGFSCKSTMNITCCRIISCTLQLYVLVLRIVRFQIFFSFVFEAFSKKEAGGRHFTTRDPHLHCNSFVCICTVHNVKKSINNKKQIQITTCIGILFDNIGVSFAFIICEFDTTTANGWEGKHVGGQFFSCF